MANSQFNEFVKWAKKEEWSFAYTQFCPGLYKYKLDSKHD